MGKDTIKARITLPTGQSTNPREPGLYQNKPLNFITKNYLILFVLFSCFIGRTQVVNYVNNPGFEIALPSATVNPYETAKYWGPLDSISNNGSHLLYSKYLGTCPIGFGGFQYPKSGNNFVGSIFYCDYSTCPTYNSRWNPRNRLKQTLKSNVTYCAKYHIVNTNNCVVGISSYGAYFGGAWMDTTKYCSIPLSYLSPQILHQGGIITDTLNWVPITGTFVANGTEKYMVLGNFKSNTTTQTIVINPTYLPALGTDVLIDDVSLIEMDLAADAGHDKSIPPGDSAFIGRQPDIGIDEACIWYKMTSPTTSISIDTVAGLWVKPVTTTTYVVRQQLWCANTPKWDTVVVFMNLVGIGEELRIINEQLQLYPLPAQDFLHLKIPNEEWMKDFKTLSIYDHLGREMLQSDCSFKAKTETVNIRELPNGIYFLEVKSLNGQKIRKRFVVNR